MTTSLVPVAGSTSNGRRTVATAVTVIAVITLLVVTVSPASALTRRARSQTTWGNGPISCRMSASFVFTPPLTSTSSPSTTEVTARISHCLDNTQGEGVAGGILTGSYAASPLGCSTLSTTAEPVSGQIHWRGPYRPTEVRNGEATGGFQGLVTMLFGPPSRFAARCAQGIAVVHVGGTISIGPSCGPGQGPVTIYPIASGPICGGKYAPTSIAAGADGALWFNTRVRNGNTFFVGRMTTSGAVSLFPSPVSFPNDFVTGPDGAMWFTGTDTIGRVTPSGQVTTFGPFFDGAGNLLLPAAITTGPDGALWFTSVGHWLNNGPLPTRSPGYLGRLTTSGAFSYFPLSAGEPAAITTGPDGALWFVTAGTWSATNTYVDGFVGKMTTSGAETDYGAVAGVSPQIVAGPDGALWFLDGSSAVGRIATDGTMSTYPLSGPDPVGIAAGPDGALWLTDYSYSPTPGFGEGGSIARMTTSGQVTVYASPGIDGPWGITAGPDGAMWFANYEDDTIGRITTP